MMNNKLIFPFSRYYSPIVTWMKLSMNTIMQESVFLRMTVAFFLIAGVIGYRTCTSRPFLGEDTPGSVRG